MRKFLIGAAAIALAASGASADPGGKGGGGGNGKGGGNDHAAMGHGGGKPDKGSPGGGQAKADRGHGQAKADRGPEVRQERQAARQVDRGHEVRGNGKDGREVVRHAAKAERRVERAVERRDRDVVEVRDVRDDRRRGDDVRIVRTVSFDNGPRGLIDGCPPGLAKKHNGCMPPGLAKQRDRDWRGSFYQPSWFGYDRLSDGRYYYDDGYLYRVGSNNSVLGYVPLLGGALSVGNPWPSYYDPYEVPQYYQDYYNLGAPNSYRYADDVLYRVDPQSGMINSIAALLTGDQFAVGQPMPAGYDVYNVPYGYQDRYYDTDDAYYRYADGYVYEVDPTTQLVQAVIELLV